MGTPKGTVPWNAGMGQGWTDKRGYRWLYVEENGKRRARREHRVIMERLLGRRLEPWELVHHKDENPSNNAIDNLELREFGEHTAEHHNGSRHSYQSKRRMEAFGLMRDELRRIRDINADMLAALKTVVAQIEDYERINNLAPNPGRQHCWDCVAHAHVVIAKAEGRS